MSLKFGTGQFNLASAKFRWLNPTNSKFLMLSYCWQTLKYFFRWYRPNNILQASALQTRQTEIEISQLTSIFIRNYFIQSLRGQYLLIDSWNQNISAHVKHVQLQYFELSSVDLVVIIKCYNHNCYKCRVKHCGYNSKNQMSFRIILCSSKYYFELMRDESTDHHFHTPNHHSNLASSHCQCWDFMACIWWRC